MWIVTQLPLILAASASKHHFHVYCPYTYMFYMLWLRQKWVHEHVCSHNPIFLCKKFVQHSFAETLMLDKGLL